LKIDFGLLTGTGEVDKLAVLRYADEVHEKVGGDFQACLDFAFKTAAAMKKVFDGGPELIAELEAALPEGDAPREAGEWNKIYLPLLTEDGEFDEEKILAEARRIQKSFGPDRIIFENCVLAARETAERQKALSDRYKRDPAEWEAERTTPVYGEEEPKASEG
jgi:hypothetical protein